MKVRRGVLFGTFVLCLSLLSSISIFTRAQEEDYEEDDDDDVGTVKVVFKFKRDGDDTVVEFHDNRYGDVHVSVPRFFENFTGNRILKELNYYFEVGAGRRWSERVVLEIFYYAVTYGTDHDPDTTAKRSERDPKGLEPARNWLDEDMDVCEWEGITCGILVSGPTKPRRHHDSYYMRRTKPAPPTSAITKIDLVNRSLTGTLPLELAFLNHLQCLSLNENKLYGTIPGVYGHFPSLHFLDLGRNQLTGTIPWSLGHLSSKFEELWLEDNELEGPIPFSLTRLTDARYLDLSGNRLSGTIPPEIGMMASLVGVHLENNQLTGSLVPEVGSLKSLRVLYLAYNQLSGSLPTEIGLCNNLVEFAAPGNLIEGTLPTEILHLSRLESLFLGENRLSGTIPSGDDRTRSWASSEDKVQVLGYRWSTLEHLTNLVLDRNRLEGSFPAGLALGLGPSLTRLDLGYNELTGTIPPEIGRMSRLTQFTGPFNHFRGTLPFEMGRLTNLMQLNLTSNLLTGTVPLALCEDSDIGSVLEREFGCDYLLCPAGTFHPEGAASMFGGCRRCPSSLEEELLDPPMSKILGRQQCDSAEFIVGDANADGFLSPREILRLLYVFTDGAHWGEKFEAWRDLEINECDLPGITCVGWDVARIDLAEAQLCSDGQGKEGSVDNCLGLPTELGLMTTLEVLSLPRRNFLRGTIPTEIGELTKLKYLDISSCQSLSGTIPTEIGLLTDLRVLNLSSGNFNGTIPMELFNLVRIEKFNLSLNPLTGTLPSLLGNLKSVKELMLSRALFSGSLPSSIGNLSRLENLEIYGNVLTGTIPNELGLCTGLKRIDAFNNKFSGTIPTTLGNLSALQILHVKTNQLTGTIPSSIGALPHLIWFDASLNTLHGTIPPSFGTSRSIRDLRLGGNRIHDPIPPGLCSNSKINGGNTKPYGCDAILCRLGRQSESGFASDSTPCEICPGSDTTIYLGSTACIRLTGEDILSMMYDIMKGETWEDNFRYGWKDATKSFCDWEGISCDEESGQISRLSFPIPAADII